ncbi:MAG TPA: hypothetical protein VGQ36_03125 [Thermoanaerobaculia bacterium]|jgi:hypothetical protein|nr:hypothetical protein [Thermoanaerobaculia bacterium]
MISLIASQLREPTQEIVDDLVTKPRVQNVAKVVGPTFAGAMAGMSGVPGAGPVVQIGAQTWANTHSESFVHFVVSVVVITGILLASLLFPPLLLVLLFASGIRKAYGLVHNQLK